MGGLLREVLKTLCSVNQWCYAVFWKIGCHNPKVLIWEECYCDYSAVPNICNEKNFDGFSSNQLGVHVRDNRVHLLINKMMIDNQIYVVGEGIVGRALFTGDHEWFLAKDYPGDAHPPVVTKEVYQQFSAGIQTVAVIPVFPHGVVQFGSSSMILENAGYVNNVKSLLLQLGCVPGALFSDTHMETNASERIGMPVFHETPASMHLPGHYSLSNSTSLFTDNQRSISSVSLGNFDRPSCSQMRQMVNQNPAASVPHNLNHTKTVDRSHDGLYEGKATPLMKPNDPFISQFEKGFVGAEVIPSSADVWLKQHATPHYLRPSFTHQPIGKTSTGFDNGFLSTDSNKKMDELIEGLNIRSTEPNKDIPVGPDLVTDHLEHANGNRSKTSSNVLRDGNYAPPPSGDDLYDILGVDLKNKLFNGQWSNIHSDDSVLKAENTGNGDASTSMNTMETGLDFYSQAEMVADRYAFSLPDNDQLLDAVISKAHSATKQSSDDNVSCRTTLTKISSSSVPSSSMSCDQAPMPDQVKKEFNLPKALQKLEVKPSTLFRSGSFKDGTGCSSENTSIYGSQLSSWVSQNMKSSNSIQTALSKKNDQTSKPNRKRLKPGENPRPRPKDRQMIQDRLKELRELIPNGAKCSIDSLLEQTIKHMLFLQNVTKHADKLKHMAESKIIDKEGGLRGATWAFEMGSQSNVCPIIVEDLNPPRQMLVEMFCEERGFFLEIADLIRGLGLTILKGVMENRNNKIWARFVVEADRDVTRMEIFMSLVCLLEQTMKGSGTSGSENKMMVHHAISQATSIPATGRPSSLQ